jgi:hypothetical protein
MNFNFALMRGLKLMPHLLHGLDQACSGIDLEVCSRGGSTKQYQENNQKNPKNPFHCLLLAKIKANFFKKSADTSRTKKQRNYG